MIRNNFSGLIQALQKNPHYYHPTDDDLLLFTYLNTAGKFSI